ncbi:MAG: erythromycin esterase family protein [Pseudoxanthomonas sp.]
MFEFSSRKLVDPDRLVLLVLIFLIAAPSWAMSATFESADATPSDIDRAVNAICSKDMVLLGEDNHHAGATTIAVKIELIERLIQKCGFRGVVFESQFYDLLDFEHAVVTGSATKEQLSDAIGAVWSRYPEFKKFAGWLYEEARARRIYIAGMDTQVGGIGQNYSLQKLPTVLSSVLTGSRQMECEALIGRQNRWEYDDAYPYDAALRELHRCLRDIRRELDMGHAPPDLRAMADSYARYLDFANGDEHGLREKAMYENLIWTRARWPKGVRVIVWCASVHAVKTLDGVREGIRPFGSYVHEVFGSKASAIGFSALAGSYGNVGGGGMPNTLSTAQEESLEAQAYKGASGDELRFLDFSQLRAMGVIPARALNYGKPMVVDWSELLDGMIVLRQETAAMAEP